MKRVWFLKEFGGCSAYLTTSTGTDLSGELIYDLKKYPPCLNQYKKDFMLL